MLPVLTGKPRREQNSTVKIDDISEKKAPEKFNLEVLLPSVSIILFPPKSEPESIKNDTRIQSGAFAKTVADVFIKPPKNIKAPTNF